MMIIILPYITLSIRGTRLWDKATWLNKLVTGLYGFVVFWTESLSVQKRSRVELATCSVSTNVIMLRLETLFWIHVDQDFVSPISGTHRCSLPTGIIFPSFHCVVRGLLLQADPQGEWSEMHWDGLDGCDHRVLMSFVVKLHHIHPYSASFRHVHPFSSIIPLGTMDSLKLQPSCWYPTRDSREPGPSHGSWENLQWGMIYITVT